MSKEICTLPTSASFVEVASVLRSGKDVSIGLRTLLAMDPNKDTDFSEFVSESIGVESVDIVGLFGDDDVMFAIAHPGGDGLLIDDIPTTLHSTLVYYLKPVVWCTEPQGIANSNTYSRKVEIK